MLDLSSNITKLNDTIKASRNNLTDFDTKLKQEKHDTAKKYNETKRELEDLKTEQQSLNSELQKSKNIYKDIYENGK